MIAVIITSLVGAAACSSITDQPRVTESSSASVPQPTDGADSCDAPVGEFERAPDDLRWEAVDGVSWPVSDSLGPTANQDGWAVCFSRSPVGAALAATSMLFAAAEHSGVDVTEFYMIDSPGKTAALEDARSTDTPDFVADMRETGMTPVGFRVDEYTPDRASLQLVFSLPQSRTGYVGIPITTVWTGGDWRLKVLDDGTLSEVSEMTADDFAMWVNPGD
ncbi:hypothetical protein [Microbacterium sp. 179-I 3D4 NHS]|uniref:hypothetical protein n=1 Tax=Microbacterium sp. 179-I 3D4 NHS TaxID=3142381 RepID=UPI0039A3A2C9